MKFGSSLLTFMKLLSVWRRKQVGDEKADYNYNHAQDAYTPSKFEGL